MSRDERDAPPPSPPGPAGAVDEGDAAEHDAAGGGDAEHDAAGGGDAEHDAAGAGAGVGKAERSRRGRRAQRPSASATDVPPFAAAYPDDPALRELVRAFQAGDYGRVRREAPALAERSADERVARAARDLRARLDPDALTLGIFIGTGLLLALLTAWSYGHAR